MATVFLHSCKQRFRQINHVLWHEQLFDPHHWAKIDCRNAVVVLVLSAIYCELKNLPSAAPLAQKSPSFKCLQITCDVSLRLSSMCVSSMSFDFPSIVLTSIHFSRRSKHVYYSHIRYNENTNRSLPRRSIQAAFVSSPWIGICSIKLAKEKNICNGSLELASGWFFEKCSYWRAASSKTTLKIWNTGLSTNRKASIKLQKAPRYSEHKLLMFHNLLESDNISSHKKLPDSQLRKNKLMNKQQ